MSYDSIYIACYPKVGSEYLKRTLQQSTISRRRSVIKTHHHMHLKRLEENPYFCAHSKIVYLCANPMDAVLSLLNKHFHREFVTYNPTLKCKKFSRDVLISYDNIFASTTTSKNSGKWTGHHTLTLNPKYREKTLTVSQIEDINKNFVSYILNNDFLGYQEHFDTWTKTPMSYERCILRYEYLEDLDTLRSLEEFLEGSLFSLEKLAINYKQRRNRFVLSPGPMETALEKTYGPLAAEIDKLDGFTRILRE